MAANLLWWFIGFIGGCLFGAMLALVVAADAKEKWNDKDTGNDIDWLDDHQG